MVGKELIGATCLGIVTRTTQNEIWVGSSRWPSLVPAPWDETVHVVSAGAIASCGILGN